MPLNKDPEEVLAAFQKLSPESQGLSFAQLYLFAAFGCVGGGVAVGGDMAGCDLHGFIIIH